jgi:hypothetical protein
MPQWNGSGRLNAATWPVLATASLALSTTAASAQVCPAEGDATQQLARELNPLKNREQAPLPSEINPNATLAAVLAKGQDLNRWSASDASIFEGVVINVKEGGIESVNCHARDPAHRDTHIELALNAGAPASRRVIVEVTPRWREKISAVFDWSTSSLKTQLIGRHVRITGWLFNDLEHKPQAENTNPGGAHNWRATIWEIHPITGIEVILGPAVAMNATAPVSGVAQRHRSKSKRGRCARSAHHTCRRTNHEGVSGIH